MCREQETVKSLKGTYTSHPFIQGPEIFKEEVAVRLFEPQVDDDIKETLFSEQNSTVAHRNLQQLGQHAQDLPTRPPWLKPDKVPA